MRGEGLHGGHGDGLVQDRLGDVRIRCGEAHPVAVELDDGDVGDLAHPAHVRIGLQYPLRGAALTAQLIGGAVGDEPAAVDDDEVVDETLDQVELVTGEEDGCTGVGEVFEDLEGAFDGDRVESGEGLVEDEGTGTVDESGRDLDLLLVAQAHGLEVVAGFAIEVELLEEFEAAPTGGVTAEAVEAGEVDELIDDRHLRVEAPLLGHVPDRTAMCGGDGFAVDGDAPGVRGEHAEDDAHGRRLAGAVGTDEPGHLAVVDAEAQVVQDLFVAEAAVDVLESDHGSTLCALSLTRLSPVDDSPLSSLGEGRCFHRSSAASLRCSSDPLGSESTTT